ncbi:hypothetical protein F5883DRAFT_113460 [Diaporthe sp. PMI_573]|nr:hypothetical protein F5883DRAFT_113460 [Diaporthaceae sp. PMI_573]
MENMDVDANLTIDFLKDRDIFRASESILVTRLKSSDTFCANTYGICPYPEGNKRLESLAGSFYSDIQSPDPFSYEMLVREDARRSENQKAIASLAPGFREAARLAETKRQQFWDDMKQQQESLRNAALLLDGSTPGMSSPVSSEHATAAVPKRKSHRFRVWLNKHEHEQKHRRSDHHRSGHHRSDRHRRDDHHRRDDRDVDHGHRYHHRCRSK